MFSMLQPSYPVAMMPHGQAMYVPQSYTYQTAAVSINYSLLSVGKTHKIFLYSFSQINDCARVYACVRACVHQGLKVLNR